MKLRHLATLCALGALGLIGPPPAAAAAPVWNLDIHHVETNFAPGGADEYWFDVNNVGDGASAGTVTLTINLPGGVTRRSVLVNTDKLEINWKCPGSVGDPTIVCTTKTTIPRHTLIRGLMVAVDVAEGASGERFASAKLEGGGGAPVSAAERTEISPDPAGFGIVPGSFAPDFFEANGITTTRAAGAHPALFSVPFDFNSIAFPTEKAILQKIPDETIRNLHVDTPPGFIGNPTAVGECSQADFTVGECPPSSQVGRIDLHLYTIGSSESQVFAPWTVGVFNLTHPQGVITDLAFQIGGNPVHVKVSLDAANDYAITSVVPDVNELLPPFDQRLTLWGIPADHSHDSERCKSFSATIGTNPTDIECSTDIPRKPFLTVPSQCAEGNVARLHHYDSWQNSGVFGSEVDYALPETMIGCDAPRFEPDVSIEPTGHQANTPTGLDVHIEVAQNENPNALGTPPVKSTVVTLPQGMSFSPSFADGLQSCSLAQMKLGTNEAIECPDASRIGEVTLHTPLLPKPAEGSMYLAAQGDNPFGSLFALYLVLHDTEERGALIKIPGRIDVDPGSGQITTSFEDTPQFPFDELALKFRSGPRAPLVNPPSCGTQTIGIKVASYAQPQNPVDVSNTYQVTEGPNGSPCPSDRAHRPFAPKMIAGTSSPRAGTYSPFVFRLSREDSEQELSQVTTVLPPGLVAKIAGISFCPEAAIASISTELGAGSAELNRPACPAASQIGTISAGLGAGPGPNYFPGKVYLAGPHKGAPLSLAVVAPGLAGPFDLGNVVVRAALKVNPDNTQVTAVSDPFPTILHGVLLRVRDVRLRVDRPQSTLNPTSCAPMSVEGQITGVGGDLLGASDDSLFTATSPFQAVNCAGLSFKPKLAFRLFGGTRRGAHPKLKATLRMPAGGANIASASVALPHSEFLDQAHIGTVCTRVQFAASACPAASVYGYVKAKSPLLDEVLSGPIYLRSSSHLLPDLVAAFRGGRIPVNLSGRIDSLNGGIRNTFDFVPDVPVSWATFTFQGGSKGLLQNSRNICLGTQKATAKFKAQNGAALTLRPVLKNACGKSKK